jgi:hypothetical protein
LGFLAFIIFFFFFLPNSIKRILDDIRIVVKIENATSLRVRVLDAPDVDGNVLEAVDELEAADPIVVGDFDETMLGNHIAFKVDLLEELGDVLEELVRVAASVLLLPLVAVVENDLIDDAGAERLEHAANDEGLEAVGVNAGERDVIDGVLGKPVVESDTVDLVERRAGTEGGTGGRVVDNDLDIVAVGDGEVVNVKGALGEEFAELGEHVDTLVRDLECVDERLRDAGGDIVVVRRSGLFADECETGGLVAFILSAPVGKDGKCKVATVRADVEENATTTRVGIRINESELREKSANKKIQITINQIEKRLMIGSTLALSNVLDELQQGFVGMLSVIEIFRKMLQKEKNNSKSIEMPFFFFFFFFDFLLYLNRPIGPHANRANTSQWCPSRSQDHEISHRL